MNREELMDLLRQHFRSLGDVMLVDLAVEFIERHAYYDIAVPARRGQIVAAKALHQILADFVFELADRKPEELQPARNALKKIHVYAKAEAESELGAKVWRDIVHIAEAGLAPSQPVNKAATRKPCKKLPKVT